MSAQEQTSVSTGARGTPSNDLFSSFGKRQAQSCVRPAAFLLLSRGNDKVLQHPRMVGRELTVCFLLRQGLPEAQFGLEQIIIPCQPPECWDLRSVPACLAGICFDHEIKEEESSCRGQAASGHGALQLLRSVAFAQVSCGCEGWHMRKNLWEVSLVHGGPCLWTLTVIGSTVMQARTAPCTLAGMTVISARRADTGEA